MKGAGKVDGFWVKGNMTQNSDEEEVMCCHVELQPTYHVSPGFFICIKWGLDLMVSKSPSSIDTL